MKTEYLEIKFRIPKSSHIGKMIESKKKKQKLVLHREIAENLHSNAVIELLAEHLEFYEE